MKSKLLDGIIHFVRPERLSLHALHLVLLDLKMKQQRRKHEKEIAKNRMITPEIKHSLRENIRADYVRTQTHAKS